MKLKYLLAALVCFALSVGVVKWAFAQQYGATHYADINLPCSCDSLCGPNWTNFGGSPTTCSGTGTTYYLTDWVSRIGVGSRNNVHNTAIMNRKPTMALSNYETVSDQTATLNGALTTDPWYIYLQGRGQLAEYERSFLHFGETTDICYEVPYGTCFALRFTAGQKVPAYLAAANPLPTQIATANCNSPPACPGTSHPVYDADDYLANNGQTRFMSCYSDGDDGSRATLRGLYRDFIHDEIMLNPANGQLRNDTRWFTGMFADNATWGNYQIWGASVAAGGHCTEHMADPIYWSATDPFVTWFRGGRNQMLALVKTDFDNGAAWHPSGIPLKLTINVGADYNQPWGSTAHIYLSEWGLGLFGTTSSNTPAVFYTNSQSLPIAWSTSGKRCSAGGFNPCAGASGCLSYGQLQYSSYALYRAVASSDDYWGMQYHTAQCDRTSLECGATGNKIFASDKRWKEKVIGYGAAEKSMELGQLAYLGTPTGPLVVHWEASTSGTAQRIYRRPFTRGWVWVRHLDAANSTDSLATMVSLNFSANGGPTTLQHVVKLDGTLTSTAYGSIYLPAGRGVITISQGASGCCPAKVCCEEIEP